MIQFSSWSILSRIDGRIGERGRTPRAKKEGPRIFGDFQNRKPCSFQAFAEGVRTDRDERVPNMDHTHKQVLKAVASHKEPSGLKHAAHFAEQFVLQFG